MSVTELLFRACRWQIIVCLNAARPGMLPPGLLLDLLAKQGFSITDSQLELHLDYLKQYGLISRANKLTRLTGKGIDVAEYTLEAPPGVDRPEMEF